MSTSKICCNCELSRYANSFISVIKEVISSVTAVIDSIYPEGVV